MVFGAFQHLLHTVCVFVILFVWRPFEDVQWRMWWPGVQSDYILSTNMHIKQSFFTTSPKKSPQDLQRDISSISDKPDATSNTQWPWENLEVILFGRSKVKGQGHRNNKCIFHTIFSLMFQSWRPLTNYAVKAGVVCLQVKLCDPNLSALKVRFSRRGAIQIYVYLTLLMSGA